MTVVGNTQHNAVRYAANITSSGAVNISNSRGIAVGGKLLGRTIRELDVRKVYGINIIAVERDHRTDVEFAADYRFEEGDTVSVVGKVEKIDRFERTIQE